MGLKIKMFCLISVLVFTFFNLLLATLFMNFLSLMILDLNLVLDACFIFFIDEKLTVFQPEKPHKVFHDDALDKLAKKKRRVS